MADGELILKLDEDTARRLQAAADAAGRPVADYAAELISGGLDEDWAEDLRRFEEYERTGEYVTVEEAMARFNAELERRLTEKRLQPGA